MLSIGGAETEAPVLWPPDAESQLIRKRPCCWERLKAGGGGVNRGRRDGWMPSPMDGHEFEQAPEDDEGQGSLACYSPWVSKRWT